MKKVLAVVVLMAGFFSFVKGEQSHRIVNFSEVTEKLYPSKPRILDLCKTQTKMNLQKCIEKYGGNADTLMRLQFYCGDTFKGVANAKVEEQSKPAFGGESGMIEVRVAVIESNLNALKKTCDQLFRSGSFYLCKKAGKYDYLSSSFSKLTKTPCDHVVVDGYSAYCMKKKDGNYEVVESHVVDSKGGATCTPTTHSTDKGERKDAEASR